MLGSLKTNGRFRTAAGFFCDFALALAFSFHPASLAQPPALVSLCLRSPSSLGVAHPRLRMRRQLACFCLGVFVLHLSLAAKASTLHVQRLLTNEEF